ncbi:MAG: hypothetical protein ACRD5J_18795 [Nitrososphaeraceae archaeon]
MVKINVRPAIAGDDEKDRRTITQQFMRTLCNKDRAVNRGQGGNSNVFGIAEIWDDVLSAFSLEEVKKYVRGLTMEDNPDIDLVDTDHVKLTEKGRNRCDDEGFGL